MWILVEFFDETNEEQISKIATIVDNTVTACLVGRPINYNKDLEFLDAEQQEIYSSTELARGLPYAAISRTTDLEKVALLLPIRPDHFINKNFIAENVTI